VSGRARRWMAASIILLSLAITVVIDPVSCRGDQCSALLLPHVIVVALGLIVAAVLLRVGR
jgi:hypothetical protein